MTEKAEDFLNKLDKSAADAFHMEEEIKSKRVDSLQATTPSDHFHPISTRSYKPVLPSASVPARLHDMNRFGQPTTTSTPKTNLKPPLAAASVSVTTTTTTTARTTGDVISAVNKPISAKTPDSDEFLFDFLNSKDASEGNRKKVTTVNAKQLTRQAGSESSPCDSMKRLSVSSGQGESESVSAWSSGGWSLGDDVGAAQTSAAESVEAESAEENQRGSPTYSHESADPEALADAMKESPPVSISSNGEAEHQDNAEAHLSALELENRLLKNEVASLNQEISSLINHAKKSQTELVKTKEKLTEYTDSASLHDQLVQELQTREADLQEALRAKDSQLAVLRLQLEEADRSASSRQREMASLQTEQERLLQTQSSTSGMQSQALDSLRQKLTDTESLLHREQQTHVLYQKEASERQSRMEQELKSLADALTAAERKISEEKAKAAEANGQLKTVKAVLESTRQEMAEYKEKASRILQSKERLITSLRDGSEASGSVEGVSSLEFESLQQERDMLREELQKSRMTADNMRTELQDLDIQLQQEVGLAQDNIKSLEDRLAEEKHHRSEVEQELLRQKQDLQYTLDDLHRQKVSFQTRLSDREAEIEKLRSQLTAKSLSSTSESELESRVRMLTESLIQKQTTLEALSTENNSLTLQLERLGQQYRDAENSLMHTAIATHRSGAPEDDMRQRLPTLVREGVTDTEVTRRVKHYVNSIDRLSIRLGVFLRRYPMARIFVLGYMMLLHLWVVIVLATYQQEMHG